MKFYYRAVDSTGSRITGSIDSNDEGRVAEILEQKGLLPLAVQRTPFAKVRKRRRRFFGSSDRLSGKERILFVRQLATLLGADCPIDRAFDMILQRAESDAVERLASKMKTAIEGGKGVSEAMAQHGQVFSAMHVGMAAAGDEGGFLAEALDQLATYEENQARLRSQLVHALTYPAFMVAVLVVSCIVLFKFVVPSILAIVLQTSKILPLPTRMLVGLSDFMEAHLTKTLVVGASLAYAYWSYIRTTAGRRFHDGLKLRGPIVGGITQQVVVSRVCRILAMLLGGGVNLIRSLQIALGTAQNVIVEKDMHDVIRKVETGESLSDCMEASDVFPPYVASMVQLGEESGKLEIMLGRVADEYEEEYQSSLKGAVALVEPMMIAVMGLVVGFVVIAVFLPMSGMSNAV